MNASQKVPKGLIIDNAIPDSVTNSHLPDSGLAGELSMTVEQVQLNVLHLVKAGVFLSAVRINVCGLVSYPSTLGWPCGQTILTMLNFGHEKLTDAEQAGAGRYFIAVRFTNGSGSERHVSHVEFEELGEV